MWSPQGWYPMPQSPQNSTVAKSSRRVAGGGIPWALFGDVGASAPTTEPTTGALPYAICARVTWVKKVTQGHQDMRNSSFKGAHDRPKVWAGNSREKTMSNTTVDANAAGVVLVVEDDMLRRLATAAELRRLGFEVLEAASIAEAKTILKSVAVDGLMSNERLMDGRRLAQWVRRRHLPTRQLWVAYAEPQPARRPHPC